MNPEEYEDMVFELQEWPDEHDEYPEEEYGAY